ncbi:MAG: hypothetical protein J2P18_01420 [Nocardia sp.]|nr:hypothetical protein [Nocardia sp.]
MSVQAEVPLPEWPGAWGDPRPAARMIIALPLVGLMSLILFPMAVQFIYQGNIGVGIFCISGGLVCIGFFIAGVKSVRIRRKRLPRRFIRGGGSAGEPGLRILYTISSKAVGVVWLASAAVFFAVRGFYLVRNFTVSTSELRPALGDIELIFIVICVPMCVFMIGYMTLGKHRRGSIFISPDSLTIRQGSTVRVIPWGDIGNVSPSYMNAVRVVRVVPWPEARIAVELGRNPLDRIQRGYYERNMDIFPNLLGMDPALLLCLIRFYWQHPEFRPELTSDAVIDRVRRGELFE